MRLQTMRNPSKKHRRRHAAVLFGALAGMLAMNSAHAYVLIITDIGNLPAHVGNQIATFARKGQEASEWIKLAERWNDTREQFERQITKIKSLMSVLDLPGGVSMQKVDDDYLVQEKCGGGSEGFDLSTLSKVVMPSATDDIIAQQKKICAQIQMMQNRKYNETVDYLTTTMASMKNMESGMQSLRDSQSNPGAMQRVLVQQEQNRTEVERANKEYQTRMKAYDVFIAAQTRAQRVLAKTALKGSPSIIGQMGKTAILKGALSI